MTWTRLEDTFAEDPVLESTGPLASWLHVAALCYSNRNLTDGFVPRDRVWRLTAIDDPDEHAEQLVNVGAWQRVDGGFRIVHHLEFQPTADSVRHKRKLNSERQRRWRERDKKSGRYVDASSSASTDTSSNASPDPLRKGGSRARAIPRRSTPRCIAPDCHNGWLGEDAEGRPIPCPTCRPGAAESVAARESA